jgi:two-component system, NarL family, response regulator LiaR
VTIRVVIADDHRVVRDGLCCLLSQEPDIEVAGEAADGRRTIDVAAATRPDVLLLDLYMPGLDGHAVLAALHDTPHRPAVVVLTSAADSGRRAGGCAHVSDRSAGRPTGSRGGWSARR